MRTDFQYLLVRQDDAVLSIKMNRPEVLNAVNDSMLRELTEVVQAASNDDAVRCLVLSGAGRAFGSGQDLTAFTAAYASNEPIRASEHLKKYHQLILLLQAMPKPIIAAIHGVATGVSLNIALACDLRIAADNARFNQAFARIGLVPDGGGAYFLTRLIGTGRALEMALLAEDINAAEAERIGMINRCVPLAELEATSSALAQRLASGPTQTYGLIKKLIYGALDSDLQTTLEMEGRLQDVAISSADHREGVTAFLQKRPPHYSGK